MTKALEDYDFEHLNQEFSRTKGNLFLLKKSTMLGSILAQVNFEWVVDPMIPTAAISMDTLYWNPEFFLEKDLEENVFILAHELSHIKYLHVDPFRIGDRDPTIWNYAGDFVINYRLKHDNPGHTYFKMPEEALYDKKYNEKWATEQVYDDLLKQIDEQSTLAEKLENSALKGDIQPSGSSGSETGDEDLKNKKHKLMKTVISAATVNSLTDPGSIPGEVERIIDQYLNPKLPWHEIFINYFTDQEDFDRSWARLNRRTHSEDFALPSYMPEEGKLKHMFFAQDVSGSITDADLKIFNSELKYIQEVLNPTKLTMCTFDTHIRLFKEFEMGDPFDKIKTSGGGGTSLNDVWKKIEELRPSVAVIFTDLCVTIPPKPDCDVIWIATNDKIKPPYGKLIIIHARDRI